MSLEFHEYSRIFKQAIPPIIHNATQMGNILVIVLSTENPMGVMSALKFSLLKVIGAVGSMVVVVTPVVWIKTVSLS